MGRSPTGPCYAAIGVILEAVKDVCGLRAGSDGESAKLMEIVLATIENCCVRDTFFLVGDGLKGLPEVVTKVWPLTTVQTCIISLLHGRDRVVEREIAAGCAGSRPLPDRAGRPEVPVSCHS